MMQARPQLTLSELCKVLHGVNLLVADDDEGTLDLLKYHFNEVGWSGTYVTSATGIIDAINAQCAVGGPVFDAIIADVNYWKGDGPRITGITAARQVRKVLPDIPIIFITGVANSLIREEVRRVHGEVIVKPFDFDTLVTKVSQLIYWHRLSNAASQKIGEERRYNSVNRTPNARRTGDTMKLAPSPIIENVIEDIRRDAKTNERG